MHFPKSFVGSIVLSCVEGWGSGSESNSAGIVHKVKHDFAKFTRTEPAALNEGEMATKVRFGCAKSSAVASTGREEGVIFDEGPQKFRVQGVEELGASACRRGFRA